jgi:hypothetical protein
VRGKTASAMQLGEAAGVAVTPALLVPLPGREGWVGQDRFVILSDRGKPGFVALEAASLDFVGRAPLAPEVAGAVPGRMDISNRSQIAFQDPNSGRAYALPARFFAALVSKAKFRWKQLEPDSTGTGSQGQ